MSDSIADRTGVAIREYDKRIAELEAENERLNRLPRGTHITRLKTNGRWQVHTPHPSGQGVRAFYGDSFGEAIDAAMAEGESDE